MILNPKINDYAVGMMFLPSKKDERKICIESFKKKFQSGTKLGWRNVPVDKKHMGKTLRKLSHFLNKFFSKEKKFLKLNSISNFTLQEKHLKFNQNSNYLKKITTIFSLSPRTIIYKGLLTPQDIGKYFIDLNDSNLVTKLALVHQRFSQTLSLDLAQLLDTCVTMEKLIHPW